MAGFVGNGGYHGIYLLGELVEIAGRSMAVAAGDAGPNTRPALIDAFLAIASISQVVGDYLHRDLGDLNRIAKYSSRLPGLVGIAAGDLLAGSARIGQRLRSTREEDYAHWLAQIEDLSARLAHTLWSGSYGASRSALSRRWDQIAVMPDGLPTHLLAIPPRCFFSFDQRPEDCLELASRFAQAEPDLDRAALVVGVRTSGCFMAPILEAGLRTNGFSNVGWMSWRPGQPVLARDRAAVRRAVARQAQVLIVDDPPTSGGSLARVASELMNAGIADDQITFLLQVFPNNSRWEKRLARWRTIKIDWPDWSIHRRLEETGIAADMSELVVGRGLTVEGATRLPTHSGADPIRTDVARRHRLARYRVRLRAEDGSRVSREISVKGVGLGMFGGRVEAAAGRLRKSVPDVYGVKDGLLYQEWVADEHAIDESDRDQRRLLAQAIGRYAAHRAAALPVEADRSLQAIGHDALWEQAGRWLGSGFGRLALPLRPLLHASGRRLIRARQPSLIDGATGPGHWFAAGDAIVKSDWDEAAFVYQIPFTYDAAYDVAMAAAARLPDEAFGSTVRAEYESTSKDRIDEVRWFLYRLLSELDRQTWTRHQTTGQASSRKALIESLTAGERRASGLHRAFLSEAYLGDVTPSRTGELCAIDVDGVLESAQHGYAAPSAAGLLGLRAILVHGMRPVIATGRSLDESVQRCRDYRLAGAVAEYEAVIHDASTGRSEVLLSPAQIDDLEQVRAAVAQLDGVELDSGYRHSVRAFTVRNNRRCAITYEVATSAIAAAGLEGRIHIVQGWAQTDFVASNVDKATGLLALSDRLGESRTPRLALAVGDSKPDLPMLRLARVACVPANADAELRLVPGVLRCSHRYGQGLADAVGKVVGHAPGSCSTCAAPSVTDVDARLLLTLLRVWDQRGLGKLPAIAAAFRAVRRAQT